VNPVIRFSPHHNQNSARSIRRHWSPFQENAKNIVSQYPGYLFAISCDYRSDHTVARSVAAALRAVGVQLHTVDASQTFFEATTVLRGEATASERLCDSGMRASDEVDSSATLRRMFSIITEIHRETSKTARIEYQKLTFTLVARQWVKQAGFYHA
jgi:hypothetical protein